MLPTVGIEPAPTWLPKLQCWTIRQLRYPLCHDDSLIKDHFLSENWVLLDSPQRNEEMEVSLSETFSKRDELSVGKQKKISVCLTMLGCTTVDVIIDKKLDDPRNYNADFLTWKV